jgi:hypothetical protein
MKRREKFVVTVLVLFVVFSFGLFVYIVFAVQKQDNIAFEKCYDERNIWVGNTRILQPKKGYTCNHVVNTTCKHNTGFLYEYQCQIQTTDTR